MEFDSMAPTTTPNRSPRFIARSTEREFSRQPPTVGPSRTQLAPCHSIAAMNRRRDQVRNERNDTKLDRINAAPTTSAACDVTATPRVDHIDLY
jgi:hypothetical protein